MEERGKVRRREEKKGGVGNAEERKGKEEKRKVRSR
jgi:hypothetical protein